MTSTATQSKDACQKELDASLPKNMGYKIMFCEAENGFRLFLWYKYTPETYPGRYHVPQEDDKTLPRLTRLTAEEVIDLSRIVATLANKHGLKSKLMGLSKEEIIYFLKLP